MDSWSKCGYCYLGVAAVLFCHERAGEHLLRDLEQVEPLRTVELPDVQHQRSYLCQNCCQL
jgi:hypothetical protein